MRTEEVTVANMIVTPVDVCCVVVDVSAYCTMVDGVVIVDMVLMTVTVEVSDMVGTVAGYSRQKSSFFPT